MEIANAKAHRSACLRIVICLLAVWFLVSFGCGILFREQLDRFFIGHAPFGFWMAQQGAIICFIGILIAYTVLMSKLDKKFGYEENATAATSSASASSGEDENQGNDQA
jgi:putative solute:sodium symporter small subunit